MRLGRAIVWLIVIVVLGYGVGIVVQKTGSVTDSLTNRNAKDDGLYRPESVIVFVTPQEDGALYSGVITLPNPCYEWSYQGKAKHPEFVTLEFVSEPTTVACVQMIEEREFSVDVAGAMPDAAIDLVFNGRKVPVTRKIIE